MMQEGAFAGVPKEVVYAIAMVLAAVVVFRCSSRRSPA